MNEWTTAGRKSMAGILALLCLAVAGALWLLKENPEQDLATSAFTKVGIVMAALWLALPSRGDASGWDRAFPIGIAVIVLLSVLRVKGRFLLYAIPAAILFAVVATLLRPRSRRRPRR